MRAERTHSIMLSHMLGFGLCLRGSVIIQRGKQPAPDLISYLGSHREVGKHYQLITVLPASPAFSLIALPREDSASSCFLCVLRVWAISRWLLPTCLKAEPVLCCISLGVRQTAAESPHMAKAGLSAALKSICSELQSVSSPLPSNHTNPMSWLPILPCHRKPWAKLLADAPSITLFCTSEAIQTKMQQQKMRKKKLLRLILTVSVYFVGDGFAMFEQGLWVSGIVPYLSSLFSLSWNYVQSQFRK